MVRPEEARQLVVVMGVTGSGKTTIGRRVAGALGVEFLDADDFHLPTDVEAMRAGLPLDDTRRAPWLDRLHAELATRRELGAVLACSALKKKYRRRLRGGLERLRYVALVAEPAMLRRRIETRRDHFASSSLLDSQFEALQLDGVEIVVDADQPVEDVVTEILAGLTAQ